MKEDLETTHTICLLINQDQVLLAMKKRGFGVGKWNGAGGTREEGESIEEAAIRETQEEIGVTPTSLKHTATLTFRFLDKPEWDRVVGVYIAKRWDGEPIESEEMRPQWFNIKNIPLSEMWEADTHWMPQVLEGKTLRGYFNYTSDQKLHKFKVIEGSF